MKGASPSSKKRRQSPKDDKKEDGDARDTDRKVKARNFYDAIMVVDLHTITAAQQQDERDVVTGVMRDVPDHYSGTTRNIIVREVDRAFWEAILDELAHTHTSNRVAAVGSPGIGKSTTVAFAIRLLLKQSKRVVYKFCTTDDTGYYVEFTPTQTTTTSDDDGHETQTADGVDIAVFPEATKSADIPSLLNPETYYIVDPGIGKTSCNPGPFVLCRVIIVASPDDRHWGGSGFAKDNHDQLGGEIRYFPSWTLPELEAASAHLLNVHFQDGEVAELFSLFGGVPRLVFQPHRKARNARELQNKVEAIPNEKLRNIITGQVDRHSGFGVDQPGGGVVEFRPKDDFQDVELRLASSSISDWVRARFLDSIWTAMAMFPSPMSWQFLEEFMLHALQGENAYSVRSCVGRHDARYTQIRVLNLGPCVGKTLVSDCTAAVLTGPDLTVFYSSDRLHPLYDMIYRDGQIYHAFQVTEGKTHPAKAQQIHALASRLQIGTNGRELRLYFAVHDGNFDMFATKPVAPVAVNGVSYYHLKLTRELSA